MTLKNILGYAGYVLYYGVIKKGLFKLVTLDRILNRITGVTSGCWWLVVVNAIPISDICQINQQNISSCSVINNRIKKIS
jgi:MFS-type transporter involved in bile tolerance (Atg22 family)